MEILLYLFIAMIGFAVLALLMPVKVSVLATGGTDKGFEVAGKVMFFSGIAGGGLHYFEKVYRVHMFLFSWKVFEIDVTRAIGYISSKAKKIPVKVKEKEKKEKRSLFDSLKIFYRNRVIFWRYFKKGLHDFRDIIEFDQCSADIKLGLCNPFATGWIIGIIFALKSVLPKSCVITHSWDFTRQIVHGNVTLSFTFVSLKFWKNLFRYMPLIVRNVIEYQRYKSAPITQEV